MADYTPVLGDYTELKPFRFWCQKVLPLVYDDSLSYYELLCKVVDYLNKTMEDVDTLHDDVVNLHAAYVQLQTYVNTYFDNLDVQEEINNKLDNMADDGSLTTLLAPFIPDAVTDWLNDHVEPTSPPVDNTLSISGAAADALVTGREIKKGFRYIMAGDTASTQYNRSLASIDENMCFYANTSYWDDLVSSGFFVNQKMSTSNNIQLVFDYSTGYVYTRTVNTTTGTPTSWKGIEIDNTLSVSGEAADAKVTGDEIKKGFRYIMAGDTASTQYNRSLASIDENMCFYANTSYWDDLVSSGFFVNQKMSTSNNIQLVFDYSTGYVYTRTVNTTTGTPTSWKGIEIDNTLSVSGEAADAKATGDEIKKGFRYIKSGVTASSEYTKKLYLVDENIIFYASTAYWDDTPGLNGVFINQKMSDTNNLQTFIDYQTGLIYTRTITIANKANAAWNTIGETYSNLNTSLDSWVYGYINDSTGEIISNNYACATRDFLPSEVKNITALGLTSRLFRYNLDGTYVNSTSWAADASYTLTSSYKYKFSYRNSGYPTTSDISISDALKVVFVGYVGISEFNEQFTFFKGKRISILGDSISTFTGYIPDGNQTYYPTSRVPDVTNVNDTWWKQVIDRLGATLLVNNSYSGGRVATAGESAGRAIVRCDQLSANGVNPDVIFFFMGTNDFNTNVTIGTYNGTGDFPSDSDSTFRSSYAKVLKKMMLTYPKAKIYCFTCLCCERMGDLGFPERNDRGLLNDYNNAIIDMANLFNCEIVHADKCGITYFNMSTYLGDFNYPETGQGLHPNKAGHNLIANEVLREVAKVNIFM